MTGPTGSSADTVEHAQSVILQYLASMHDGKPVQIRQQYATAALLDIAEYIAIVHGDRTDAARLRYVHAMSRLQEQGDITVQEVADGIPGNSLAAAVYSHVILTVVNPDAIRG